MAKEFTLPPDLAEVIRENAGDRDFDVREWFLPGELSPADSALYELAMAEVLSQPGIAATEVHASLESDEAYATAIDTTDHAPATESNEQLELSEHQPALEPDTTPPPTSVPAESPAPPSFVDAPDGGELNDGGGGNEEGEEQSDVGQTMEDDPTEGWDAEHKGEAGENSDEGQTDSVVTDTASNPGDSGALSDDDELAASDALAAGSSFDALASAFTADDNLIFDHDLGLVVAAPSTLDIIDQTLDAGLIQGSVDYTVIDKQVHAGAEHGQEQIAPQEEDEGAVVTDEAQLEAGGW